MKDIETGGERLDVLRMQLSSSSAECSQFQFCWKT